MQMRSIWTKPKFTSLVNSLIKPVTNDYQTLSYLTTTFYDPTFKFFNPFPNNKFKILPKSLQTILSLMKMVKISPKG